MVFSFRIEVETNPFHGVPLGGGPEADVDLSA
jgi:hypothetical protein